jgi:hypothetical protein
MELRISEFWKVSRIFVTCDSAGSDSSIGGDAGLVEHDTDWNCTDGTGSTLLSNDGKNHSAWHHFA